MAATYAGGLLLSAGAAWGQVGGAGSPDLKMQPTSKPASTRPATTQPTTAQPKGDPGETKPGTGAVVDLRPKFRQGETIRYTFEQSANNSVKSADPTDTSMDMQEKQSTRIGLVMRVTEAGDNGSTIEVKYETIKVSLTTPDGVAEFDSAKPAPKKATAPGAQPGKTPGAATPGQPNLDPLKDIADMDMNGMLGMIVGPMVGTTITVKTDKNGAVTSVSGGDALGGQLGGLGAMAGMGMMPQPQAMANWLVSGVGGPGNQGFARVGESWTNNDSLSGTPVGSFKMVTTHTLKSASGGVANVAFNGHIENGTEGGQQQPGQSAGQVQSAQYSGSYAWDTAAGALRDMATQMKVVLDAGVMGVKGRMSSETNVSVKRQ